MILMIGFPASQGPGNSQEAINQAALADLSDVQAIKLLPSNLMAFKPHS